MKKRDCSQSSLCEVKLQAALHRKFCFGRVYSKLHCFFFFEGVAAITVQFASLILIVFALNYSFM